MEPTEKVVGDTGLDYQRRFFGCEDWTDADIDEYTEFLASLPGAEWMSGTSEKTRRTYAMSCIRLREVNELAFQRGIVRGKLWLNYG